MRVFDAAVGVMVKLPLAGCVAMLWGILKELAVTVLEASTIPVAGQSAFGIDGFYIDGGA